MYLIDANVFLELLLNQKRADDCQNLLGAVQKGKVDGFVTNLVLYSILIVMEDKGKMPADLGTFLTSIASFKGLRLYFLTLLDRLEATKIMKENGLDFEDSTLIQAARRLKAKGIVSYDKDFEKVRDVERLEPSYIMKNL